MTRRDNLAKNTVANALGRCFGLLVAYVAAPAYLHFCGAEGYGSITLYLVFAAFLSLAEVGISATVARELARDPARSTNLLRTVEIVYFCGVLTIGATGILYSGIRSGWSNLGLGASVFALMPFAAAFHLFGEFYASALAGLQQQVISNMLQVSVNVARSAGGVLIAWLGGPHITEIFAWFLVCNICYAAVTRTIVWRRLNRDLTSTRFSVDEIRRVGSYSIGIFLIGATGLLLTQGDKVLVARMISMHALGYYSLAATLAMIPITLAMAVSAAAVPRLARYAQDDPSSFEREYARLSSLAAALVIPTGLVMAFFAPEVVLAWTHSPEAAVQAGTSASLLLVGQTLQALTAMPYARLVALGKLGVSVKVGIASAAIYLPMLLALTSRWGPAGAAAAWAAVNLLTFFPYMRAVHGLEFQAWLSANFWRPICVAGVVAGSGWAVQQMTQVTAPMNILLFACTWSAAAGLTAVATPAARAMIQRLRMQ